MFGPHVDRKHATGSGRPTIAAHIEAARKEALRDADFVIRAAAIFVCGPHNRTITLTDDEGDELRTYLARRAEADPATAIKAIAHSTYTAVPWAGDPDAARCIREEARVCARAGIVGLVVHLPKAPVEKVLKYAARLISTEGDSVRIYLETPATPRESYYETPEKLAVLFRELRKSLDPDLRRFGLCIDTAHLWTDGVDLADHAAANDWLTRLEAVADVIPPSHVILHLNDSLRPRGKGPDAHAGLAVGEIWRDYRRRLPESGLAAFVDYAVRHDIPAILERKPIAALAADYLVLRELIPATP